MGIIKDIEKLAAAMKPHCRAMLQKLDDEGIRYTVIETLRTQDSRHDRRSSNS